MKELAFSLVIAILLLSGCKEDEPIECPCNGADMQIPLFKACVEEDDYEERRLCSNRELLNQIYFQIVYPPEAREDTIQGTVVVDIMIDSEGHAYDFVVYNDPLLGYGLEEETIRVLKLVSENAWCPGRERCTKVNSYFRMPVKYKLR